MKRSHKTLKAAITCLFILCFFSFFLPQTVPAGIVVEEKPSIGNVDTRNALLRDIHVMKEEVKTALAKLSPAKGGDNPYPLAITKNSIPNLRNQLAALSQKIADALKGQKSDRNMLKLSEDLNKANGILAALEQNAKANMKSASQEQLHKFSDVLNNLEEDIDVLHRFKINLINPQPEPPGSAPLKKEQ